MIGVPGLAKTLLIRSLAEMLDLPFQRIQFTPDLMPSDITGTEILEESEDGRRQFRFMRGPVFASLILADEINRTPPKRRPRCSKPCRNAASPWPGTVTICRRRFL